jgi:hypothetical protein
MPVIKETHIPGKPVKEKVMKRGRRFVSDEITVNAGTRQVIDTPEVRVSSSDAVYIEVFDSYADCGLGTTYGGDAINKLGLKRTIKPGRVFQEEAVQLI